MTTKLDVTGLQCPLPIIKAKKALKAIAAGEMLEVLSTDPGSVNDFGSFCSATGNKLVETGEADGVFSFLICKAA